MVSEIPRNMMLSLKQLEIYNSNLNKLNKGLGDKNHVPVLKKRINELLKKIEDYNIELINIINLKTPKPEKSSPDTEKSTAQEINLPGTINSDRFKNLRKEEKKKFLKDLNLTKWDLKEYLKRSQKERKSHFEKKEDYTIYKPNPYGEFANKYMKKYSLQLLKKYPKFFGPLFTHIQKVNINMLSTTYVSLMLVFTIIALPSLLIIFTVLNLSFRLNFLIITGISIASAVLTFVSFYFYPASLISEKSRNIKNELPFALVHMSAVAGSGANPISIFELISESNEYNELRKETKKILNYVNLFGYNLSGALKSVSRTTPSKEFKEVLEGIITTIETGGNLRDYLREKADDALRIYQQRRKKQVEALSTYSDIYTAILIAAPLLLIVTLAIINTIGGKLAGFDASTLAILGVYGLIPLLNLGFMGFLKISQPDA